MSCNFLFLWLTFIICNSQSIISNSQPRMFDGSIIDIHDGTIMKFTENGYYYYYGMSYGLCVEPPPPYDGCYNSTMGACGFQTNHSLSIYKSNDLENWILVQKNALPVDSRPYGIYFSPSVNYNPNTQKYVLIINWWTNWGTPDAVSYLLAATSDNPEGIFEVQNEKMNMTMPTPYSSVLFVDDDNNGYLVYGQAAGWIVRVQKLNNDYLTASNEYSNIIQTSVEASTMFKYNNIYYVLTGSTCCYCTNGGDAQVYISNTPLGNYTFIGNINRYNNNSIIVHSQQNYVFPIGKNVIRTTAYDLNNTNKIQWIWTGDRWQSSPDTLKGHDFTYFYPLKFNNDGTINQIEWINQFQCNPYQ